MTAIADIPASLDVAAQIDPDVRRDVFFEDDVEVNVGRLNGETVQSYGQFGYDSVSNEVRVNALKDGAATAPDLVFRVGDDGAPVEAGRFVAADNGLHLGVSGTTTGYIESEDGVTAPVSGGATGRIRYNDTTATFQISVQGGAYDSIVVAGGAESPWTKTGAVIHPDTLTDEVSVGTASSFGKFTVAGDAVGQVTAVIRQVAAQTARVFTIQDGAGANRFVVNPSDISGVWIDLQSAAHTSGVDIRGLRWVSALHTGIDPTGDKSIWQLSMDTTITFATGVATDYDSILINGGTTLAASSATQTITRASTVHINGAPVAGANTTITTSHALEVTGAALVTGKLTVTGSIDPTDLLLSGGGTAHFFESNDGSTAAVSGGATGRLRYNDSTATWQVSVQGGAYSDVATGANPWTQTGAVIHPTTLTDEVSVGTASSFGKFTVAGDTAAQITAVIRAVASQTADILVVEQSTGTDILTVSEGATTLGVTQVAQTSGSPRALLVTAGAHTTLTGGQSHFDIELDVGRAVQLATGGTVPVYANLALSGQTSLSATPSLTAVDEIATLYIENAPTQTGNISATNGFHALIVDDGASRFDGTVTVRNAFTGTPATGQDFLWNSAKVSDSTFKIEAAPPTGGGVNPAFFSEGLSYGSIGFGTTSPRALLTATAAANVDRIVHITGGGANTGQLWLSGVNGATILLADTNATVNQRVLDLTVDSAIWNVRSITDNQVTVTNNLWAASLANGRITFGSASTLTAKVAVNGTADETQFLVQANASQTTNILVVEDSAGTDLFILGRPDGVGTWFNIDAPDATSGTPSSFALRPGTHTGVTAGVSYTEAFMDLGRSVTYTTGAAVALFTDFSFQGATTIAASAATQTITDAATVRIGGAPVAGANVTITNAYSLVVDGGNVRVDDVLIFGSANDVALQRSAVNQLQLDDNAGGSADLVPAMDNQGSVGTAALRFSLIRGVTVTSGDHIFESEDGKAKWRMYEEPDRMMVENMLTGKKYRLALEEVA